MSACCPLFSMEMFQHDSAMMFRFVLRGELTSSGVQELEDAWNTARSILGTKALEVEISGVTTADAGGVQFAVSYAGNRGPAERGAAAGIRGVHSFHGYSDGSARSLLRRLDPEGLAAG
jgi:ABC-type transporter Mla MlaB component